MSSSTRPQSEIDSLVSRFFELSRGMDPLRSLNLTLFGLWAAALIAREQDPGWNDSHPDNVWERVVWGTDSTATEDSMRNALEIEEIVQEFEDDKRYYRDTPVYSNIWVEEPEIAARNRAFDLIGLCGDLTVANDPNIYAKAAESLIASVGALSPRAFAASTSGGGTDYLLARLILDGASSVTDMACGIGSTLSQAIQLGASQVSGCDIDDRNLLLARLRCELWGGQPERLLNHDILSGPMTGVPAGAVVLDPPLESRLPVDIVDAARERAGASESESRPSDDALWFRVLAAALDGDSRGAVVLSAESVDLDKPSNQLLLNATNLGWVSAIVLLPASVRGTGGSPTAVWVIRAPEAKSNRSTLVLDLRMGSTDSAGTLRRSVSDSVAELISDWEHGLEIRIPLWAAATVLQGGAVSELLSMDRTELDLAAALRSTVEGRLLRSLSIGNFKSLEQVSATLRPITLIFGPNSAGKSSLLQALLALSQSMDEPRLVTAGRHVNVGTFDNVVHDHDTTGSVMLSVGFPLTGAPAGSTAETASYGVSFEASESGSTWSNISIGAGRSSMRLVNPRHDRDQSSIGADALRDFFGVPLTLDPRRRDALDELIRTFGVEPVQDEDRVDPAWTRTTVDLTRVVHELGGLDAAARVRLRGLAIEEVLAPYGPSIDDGSGDIASAVADAYEIVGAVIKAVSDQFRQLLSSIEYFGPLRPPPQRFYAVGEGPVGTWHAELAALAARPSYLRAVNDWMRQLGVPYEMELRPIALTETSDTDVVAVNLRDVRSGTIVSPSDVGFGISQVLPIIVGLSTLRDRVVCIEQPEIHLHPALQASLGDLLIEATRDLGRANQVIAETHSEHLLLRLQRRIREGELDPERVAILYVDYNDRGSSEVRRLRLANDGTFQDEWPSGFFEERLNELFGES